MSAPYIGEIRIFAGNFAPAGWMFCEGQLLPISEYETLFNLIGTTYGGDGESTFVLPDLRGRIPVHQGNGYMLAEQGGVETVTLTVAQIPAHNHALLASKSFASATTVQQNLPAQANVAGIQTYRPGANGKLSPSSIASTGGSQAHNNFQPYLCVNFIIAFFGIFPSPT